MKTLAGVFLALLFSISIGAHADNWDINYCKDLTASDFSAAAKSSFARRRYEIESDTPDSLIGSQRGAKVEIAMTGPGQIVIQWVTGFAHTTDSWLTNLKEDMLWNLAGKEEPGELSINWCKDLTEEDFHAVAIWSLEKRNYQIEEDTPSSLTGSQRGLKVQVAMATPGQIVIRWVPEFGHSSNKWLHRVYRDMTSRLAE